MVMISVWFFRYQLIYCTLRLRRPLGMGSSLSCSSRGGTLLTAAANGDAAATLEVSPRLISSSASIRNARGRSIRADSEKAPKGRMLPQLQGQDVALDSGLRYFSRDPLHVPPLDSLSPCSARAHRARGRDSRVRGHERGPREGKAGVHRPLQREASDGARRGLQAWVGATMVPV